MRAVRTGRDTRAAAEEGDTSAKESESAGVEAAPAPAPVAPSAEAEVSTPERLASWLGMESGAVFDADEKNGGGSQPTGRGGSGRGRSGGANNRAPPPPFEANDMNGLRVETWLLEVSLFFFFCAKQHIYMQLESGLRSVFEFVCFLRLLQISSVARRVGVSRKIRDKVPSNLWRHHACNGIRVCCSGRARGTFFLGRRRYSSLSLSCCCRYVACARAPQIHTTAASLSMLPFEG
ncbi:unnamed protein product [Pylaiella littoralis]